MVLVGAALLAAGCQQASPEQRALEQAESHLDQVRSGRLALTFLASDSDTPADSNPGTLTITFDDDAPSAFVPTTANISNTAGPESAPISLNFLAKVGADGLGDVVFAEPGALIGFAGKRTIAATLRMELPKNFQSSEFLLEHGQVDRIVHRKDMRRELARVVDYCEQK